MSLLHRRIIYLVFFAAFFIAAPLLISYSLGYRLSLPNFRLSKVGALFVKSFPEGAQIELNGKATRKKTPDQLINVPPGINTIKVTKEGYQSWAKQLEVLPGQTTFAEDILLFKNNYAPQ